MASYRSVLHNGSIPASKTSGHYAVPESTARQRLDPNAVKLLQLYPAADAPGVFNNNKVNRSQPDDNNHFDIGDENVSTRDQLSGRVSYSRRHANFPGDFTARDKLWFRPRRFQRSVSESGHQ